MKHFGIYPAGIITVEKLADEEKVLSQTTGKASEPLKKIKIKTICNIKPDTVYAEIIYPEFH